MTGRHHQIRVQFADFRHPVAGDKKYGVPEPEGLKIRYPALCACRLAFTDPETGRRLNFAISPKGGLFEYFKEYFPQQ